MVSSLKVVFDSVSCFRSYDLRVRRFTNTLVSGTPNGGVLTPRCIYPESLPFRSFGTFSQAGAESQTVTHIFLWQLT
jgi:hypothetical protein